MSVRVAVVGLGWAGRELWLPLLREHNDFKVVAAVDADPAARQAFTKATGIPTAALLPPPPDWAGEIDVLAIDGLRTNEHALFHRRSRTLVVADLFFSFPRQMRGWPRFFVRHIMRLPRLFGVSVFFRRLMIRDKQAFMRSMNALLRWDFERLIVAHWEPIEKDAKEAVEQALRDGGFQCGTGLSAPTQSAY